MYLAIVIRAKVSIDNIDTHLVKCKLSVLSRFVIYTTLSELLVMKYE